MFYNPYCLSIIQDLVRNYQNDGKKETNHLEI